ncbi:hypothetical protein GCM10010411_55950 [Actinomadura fulvescens]|uniref:Transposase n=1 Tax=Actinomadura fulvescens TaxID=46160 RepID=A0ABP6CCV5_9ACTN
MVPQHQQREQPDPPLTRSQPCARFFMIDAAPTGIDNPTTTGLSAKQTFLPTTRPLTNVMHKSQITGQLANPKHRGKARGQRSGSPKVIFKSMTLLRRIHAMGPQPINHSPLPPQYRQSGADNMTWVRQSRADHLLTTAK